MKILSLLVALSLATPAVAFENFYDAPPRKRIIKVHAKKKRAPAVMGYEKRAPQYVDKHCMFAVRVVGSQWATESGATESAEKAFMEFARFHYGEAYMDINNAIDRATRCTRSSIGEVVGQTLHRCELVAVPCRPAMAEGGGQ
jgi:hypothetical protein